MKQDYDVIIIGGGLLGCATAYQLAKRKAGKVLLLDANEIASQASSRAACLLTRARTKPALMEMVQETYDCIDEIEHLLGESLELQQCGSVTISSSDASLKELEALEEASVRFGIPNERIDRRRLKELLPWMEVSAVEEALYMPTDAFIDCALLCSGYARAARSLGAELRPNTKVKAIVAVGDKTTGVELADGEKVLAPVVVNAAGSWANLLMRPLGVGLPFTPVRSHFWITGTNSGRFPANHPFTVIPDARAFTRSDVGALIIGLRESECQAFNPDTLTDKLEDFDFNKAAEWKVLDECAPVATALSSGHRNSGYRALCGRALMLRAGCQIHYRAGASIRRVVCRSRMLWRRRGCRWRHGTLGRRIDFAGRAVCGSGRVCTGPFRGQWTRFRLSFKKGVRMPVPIKKVDRVRIYGR